MNYITINKTYIAETDMYLTNDYDLIVIAKPNITIYLPIVFNKKIIIEGNYEDPTDTMPFYVNAIIDNKIQTISSIKTAIILSGIAHSYFVS